LQEPRYGKSTLRTPFLQMTFDANQLVIAAQTTTLERLATAAVECISDSATIVSIVALQHGGSAALIHHDSLRKEQVRKLRGCGFWFQFRHSRKFSLGRCD